MCVSASSTPSCDHYRRGATSRWGVRPKSGMDFFILFFLSFLVFVYFFLSIRLLFDSLIWKSSIAASPRCLCLCVYMRVCVCACVTHDGDEPIKGPPATKGMFIDGLKFLVVLMFLALFSLLCTPMEHFSFFHTFVSSLPLLLLHFPFV